jgi:germination protein YpeB
MKETYFMKTGNIVTINYAYEDKTKEINNKGIICYPDLIKVKVALDDGEILGIECLGYLNSHTERDFEKIKISLEEAKQKLNPDIQINSEGLAIIPTEWKTEILCYEFKGKVEDKEFIVYINAETGEEEDVLVILETPGGTLTM